MHILDCRDLKMITLHPEILSKDGKKEFAVLPYEQFLALQELLADWLWPAGRPSLIYVLKEWELI